jgi:hypothetical protein
MSLNETAQEREAFMAGHVLLLGRQRLLLMGNILRTVSAPPAFRKIKQRK